MTHVSMLLFQACHDHFYSALPPAPCRHARCVGAGGSTPAHTLSSAIGVRPLRPRDPGDEPLTCFSWLNSPCSTMVVAPCAGGR